ncbi:diacylglycerol/lipid kinase family protein [Sphingomonas sp. URHD0057]|uniref:diacylglycerol/lipid kinase family protein n=1 Tax=Sphingomonas sp. URHD0057 TaxID=1380389 RepID=UPI00048E216B|nr:diacylglycerol kinase family protein [Sphingomonas sp. URHD0057]
MPVAVLLNRGGGAVAADAGIADKVATALSEAGVDAAVELIDGGDCEVRSKAVAERGDALLIVGGGDGTIGAAASALIGTGTRLGILPLGTLNHFARDLGIPADLGEAAKLIASGIEKRVDVAEMNGRIFINNSAIGLYPLMVVDRDLQRRRLGRSKRLAMLVASLRTLARFNHQRLTLTVNDDKARVDTPLLFVGNNDYRLDLGAPGQRESLDDGQLCVLVMRKKTRAGLIAASIRALLRRTRRDDMVRIDGVERLRVDSHRSHLTVSLDGEVVRSAPPLDYRIRKQALAVIAPR